VGHIETKSEQKLLTIQSNMMRSTTSCKDIFRKAFPKLTIDYQYKTKNSDNSVKVCQLNQKIKVVPRVSECVGVF